MLFHPSLALKTDLASAAGMLSSLSPSRRLVLARRVGWTCHLGAVSLVR